MQSSQAQDVTEARASGPADRFRGCLLGLATGDAVGTTLEFRPRGTFAPITDMNGGGPFELSAGQWTDDTSMALCLATSLTARCKFDPADQMARYVRWLTEGYLSSTGSCFDIGGTTRGSLAKYMIDGTVFAGPTGPRTAGNGSLMRLAPVPMFYHPERQAAVHYAGESSRTTHGAKECVDACRMYADMLVSALSGKTKEEMLSTAVTPVSSKLQSISNGSYKNKPASDIKGTGYVVECLEAALWCFWSTSSFREAILEAANLGDDADTTAAVCGQIAGAYYGESNIPSAWLKKLAMRDDIAKLADDLRTKTPEDAQLEGQCANE
ncbi:unnamed protein product [Ostreobium quekettii]|uniref:ADP-ribosylglycohydrolase n=1 Tax=Ostreobium quekettii TaxID=121088 RepID=A0A8S1IZT8_9CHLO|nr:unnamed protein product [Ostreobium quekettii]|eukprot:evm.model.scf_339EXC.13 EVM.evm.TU.scf_339EXC.13   scf_339EXC:77196-78579(-)